MSLSPPRRIEPADAPAVAELLNGYSRRLYGEGEVTPAEVGHWWGDPDVEAWLGDSTYADLSTRADRTRLWLDLRGAPSTELLDVVERRAGELAASGALLRAVVASPDEDLRRLFDDAGYRYVRSSYTMRIELEGEPEPPAWPAGVAARPGRTDDAGAAYAAHMDSFADHWDFHPFPFESWRRWLLEAADADPELWLLAFGRDDVAGVSLAAPHPSGDSRAGWISILGVRRPWRGRGLGLALLRGSFGELFRRGRSVIELGVDAENTTGAVRLYERAGMHVSRRRDTLEKAL
jgi:ribosomal protein S18 acetylase RimI-like enzyme